MTPWQNRASNPNRLKLAIFWISSILLLSFKELGMNLSAGVALSELGQSARATDNTMAGPLLLEESLDSERDPPRRQCLPFLSAGINLRHIQSTNSLSLYDLSEENRRDFAGASRDKSLGLLALCQSRADRPYRRCPIWLSLRVFLS
ncbi:MAG TPA: hypothetical protein PKD05_01615 [Candidatus Melainabacteria bacterium]|nr:hypothetical protein [Candidatus Melainabacteria bacterium]